MPLLLLVCCYAAFLLHCCDLHIKPVELVAGRVQANMVASAVIAVTVTVAGGVSLAGGGLAGEGGGGGLRGEGRGTW